MIIKFCCKHWHFLNLLLLILFINYWLAAKLNNYRLKYKIFIFETADFYYFCFQNYQAKNLLNSSDGGKWKCEKNGERSASLVMQLEKAVIISSIDIGNFGSAFVEVLVNRSARDVNDFQVWTIFMKLSTFSGKSFKFKINKF